MLVMITLHHCLSARSFRPLWMLEEIGLPYDLRVYAFPPRAVAKSFLDVNPLGTVPAFFDGDVRMTESAAICQYLAARYSPTLLNVDVTDAQFGTYLNYLHFGEATLTFPQTLILRYSRFEPEDRRLPRVAEDYTKWFLGRLRGLDAMLAEREFLCGQRFTAADVSVGYALMLAEHLQLAPRFSSLISQYWERLRGRAGFQRALVAQERAAKAQGVAVANAQDAGPPSRSAIV
jgi:glutathione S-transferase